MIGSLCRSTYPHEGCWKKTYHIPFLPELWKETNIGDSILGGRVRLQKTFQTKDLIPSEIWPDFSTFWTFEDSGSTKISSQQLGRLPPKTRPYPKLWVVHLHQVLGFSAPERRPFVQAAPIDSQRFPGLPFKVAQASMVSSPRAMQLSKTPGNNQPTVRVGMVVFVAAGAPLNGCYEPLHPGAFIKGSSSRSWNLQETPSKRIW